jgi:FkbM family methyltransferase
MRSLSRGLIRLLRRCGIVLVSARHRGVRYLDHAPASAFHDVLLRVFPDLHGRRFIQVGANDGRRADPLRPFIDDYAWAGLLLEPLSTYFAALQCLHGHNPRLHLRQAAVDLSPGHRTIYQISPDIRDIPDWAHGLGSFSAQNVEQAARALGLPPNAIQPEEVRTVTWDEVWRDFGPQPCDLLVLDTEGFDIPLLRAAGLAVHRPRLILFEHAFASLDERLGFYRELLDLGYELATGEGDTVAYLPPAP